MTDPRKPPTAEMGGEEEEPAGDHRGGGREQATQSENGE